jgi:hypothetical protein
MMRNRTHSVGRMAMANPSTKGLRAEPVAGAVEVREFCCHVVRLDCTEQRLTSRVHDIPSFPPLSA